MNYTRIGMLDVAYPAAVSKAKIQRAMPSLVYHCPAWKFIACRGLGWIWPGVYFSPVAPARLQNLPYAGKLPVGWTRLCVRQCGLCASDLPILHLDLSPTIAPSAMFDADHRSVLGHELVGNIVETAEGCPFKPGQRVVSRSAGFRNCANLNITPCRYCSAGEYALCLNAGATPPAHEPIRSGGYSDEYIEHAANLLSVPDELSDDEAALIEPLACSLRAVLKAMSGISPEEASRSRILVIGAGIQGLGAVHWLSKIFRAEHVTVSARYPFQAVLARQLGASDVLEGRVGTTHLADHLKTRVIQGMGSNQLLADGFDVIIDAVGSPATFNQALRWTRPSGRIILLGAYLHRGRLDYSPVWFREVDVRGVYAHGVEHFDGRQVQTMQLVMELLQSHGKLPANLATHHLALSDYRRAIHLMAHKADSKAVKIMLRPN